MKLSERMFCYVGPSTLLNKNDRDDKIRGELVGDSVVCSVPISWAVKNRIPDFPGLRKRVVVVGDRARVTYYVKP